MSHPIVPRPPEPRPQAAVTPGALLNLIAGKVRRGLPCPIGFNVQGGGIGISAATRAAARLLTLNFETGADLKLWCAVFDTGPHQPTHDTDHVIVSAYSGHFKGWAITLTAYDRTGTYDEQLAAVTS